MSKFDLVQVAIEASAARSKGGVARDSSWLTHEQKLASVTKLADLCDGRALASEFDPPRPFDEYWGTTDDGRPWRVIVTRDPKAK